MTDAPTVAVWRSLWLPRSETFIRNQVTALTRWHPYLVGLRQLPDGLPVAADFAPYSDGPVSRASLRLGAARGQRRYDRALRASGARLVHAHFGTDAAEVLPVARRLGLPLIVTFHGYDVTRTGDRGGAAQRSTDVLREASRLVAVSDFIAERLVSLGAPEDRIRVLPIGIPVGAPPPTGAARAGVAFVGRLVDKKGVADLIDAVAGLPEDLRSTPLRIVGYGPLEGSLRSRAAERGVNASFLGGLASDEVHEVLAASAVFAAPSRTAPDGDSEGFGMVFLEASLAGAPVLSYRHGGVPEAVADGVSGLLVGEGDVAALTSALERLLRDSSLSARLGEQGRARVLADFEVGRCTARLEDLYDEVAAESSGSAG